MSRADGDHGLSVHVVEDRTGVQVTVFHKATGQGWAIVLDGLEVAELQVNLEAARRMLTRQTT